MTARFATATTDGRHVVAIAADGNTALAARVARFRRIELVRRTFGMRRLATLAGDLALLRSIHRSESTVAPCACAGRGLLRAIARDFALTFAVASRATHVAAIRQAIVVAWSIRHPT